ncbi:MAG TPA: cobalamin-independent methionine synthase II family protein [Dehalococcoidia bacterium]|nr:cobalamin-independent methionine synthase II family protein [Dehalococcoidia bacterium]
MLRSTDRILTTHTGSLPRPPDLVEMLQARMRGEPVDEQAFAARVREAVAEIVRLQVEAGIDVVNDGELSKPAFNTYVAARLDGFGGNDPEGGITFADREDFPQWAAAMATRNPAYTVRPMCIGPLGWKDRAPLEADIANLKAAAAQAGASEVFMASASIGTVGYTFRNTYYPDEEAYYYALADVLRDEYRAIVDAGFVLQIDAPDAAMGRHQKYRNVSLAEFRKALALAVEAQNHALQGIPAERVRYHVCWGNYEGPHTRDVELREIVDLVLRVNAGAYSIEAANPRHAHEWTVWRDVKLPDGKLLIPGVIESCTNYVEHPETVAQRIEQYARLVGRENVIAGTDCGFGTFAGASRVHPEVMWAKFRSLAEGAAIASKRLWA